MKGLITEKEEVGQKNWLGCLSIVSFWATAAVQQPAFYIGILSALLSLLYTLPSILVSIPPPFGTWPRGDKPHGDPRVPMSGYLPLMDGSKRTLFTDECRFSLRALSPTPPPEYLSASDEQCSTLSRHPISRDTYLPPLRLQLPCSARFRLYPSHISILFEKR